MPRLSATQAAQAIRDGALSASELLEECLHAADQLDPVLNALIWRDDDTVREAAQA